MKSTWAAVVVLLAVNGATSHAEVTFEWTTVSHPGNAPDDTGIGAVAYVYRISKFDVTNAQYMEFLNAVDPTGTNKLGLYHASMSTSANGGILLDVGATVGTRYQVKAGRSRTPVNFVSFVDAMRFSNWLQSGQGSGSTESGAYTIRDRFAETRTQGAKFFIPSEDEWYKAAYHKNDGATGNYWRFPTSTDDLPFSVPTPGIHAPSPTNTANFFRDDGLANGYNDGYAVTGSPDYNNMQHYLTDVGAYPWAPSPYTAAANILIPLAVTMAAGFEASVAVAVAFGASSAMCLPVATPPNAMVFATGRLRTWDLVRAGLVVGLVAPLVGLAWLGICLKLIFR